MLSMGTMAVGAAVNLAMNLALTPCFGVQGAAFATFFSYGLVFILRAVNTRQYIRLGMDVGKVLVNTSILAGQSLLLIYEPPYWSAWEIALTALMLLINGKGLVISVQRLLRRNRQF